MAMRGRWRRSAAMVGVLAGVGGLLATMISAVPAGAVTNGTYRQRNLVSDIPGVARVTDPHLVNPWGMSEFPGGPLWVSNNNDNTTTLYTNGKNGTLQPAPLVVRIQGGAPTGQVFNPNYKTSPNDFVVRGDGKGGPALFIFASENGDITAWNPGASTLARREASVPNAVYKGLAIGHNHNGNVLYAANFNSGKVDEFNSKWKQVMNPDFVDHQIPAGYAPFNVTNLNGDIYVSYAKQNSLKHDDVKGPGHGFIDVFNQEGRLQTRLVKHGALNSPWGMVIAPDSFGTFKNRLLVGNFGDGTINAFDPATGEFIGSMFNLDGNQIVINGLWGLIFGDASAADAKTLIFSAGIADEAHGLLGTLSAA